MPATRVSFLWLLAGIAFSASADDPEYPPLSVKLEPIRVSAHCWYVQGQAGVASKANEGYNSNAGFVDTPDGVVVIDSLGTPALGRALLAAVAETTHHPVRRLILTHEHADHMYGAQAFKEAGVEVWVHEAARDYAGSAEARERDVQRLRDLAPWVNSTTRRVRVDHWVGDEEGFELGGLHFELTHLGPAHSPEDMITFVREDGVLYSGDILYSGRIPFVGSADTRRWLATIDRLMALAPRVMVVGHGAASTAPGRDLGLTRDYLRFLREQMGRAVTEFTDFDVAYARTDWNRWKNWPAFDAANRTNAYNVYLQMEQESLAH